MSLKIAVAKLILKRKICDSYGKEYGQVIGFATGLQGNIPHIWVEKSGGEISSIPSSQIIVDKDSVFLDSCWNTQVNGLIEKTTTILQKKTALEKIYNNGEIAKNTYDNIRKQYDIKIQALLSYHPILFKKVKDRLKALSSQIEQIDMISANLKVEYSVGSLEEKTYKTTSEYLQTLFNKWLLEKNDLEIAFKKLQNLRHHTENSIVTTKKEKGSIQPISLQIKEAD